MSQISYGEASQPAEHSNLAPERWISGEVLNAERYRIKTAGEASIFGLRVVENDSDLQLTLWSALDFDGKDMVHETTITDLGTSSITLYKNMFYSISVSKADGTVADDGTFIKAHFIV